MGLLMVSVLWKCILQSMVPVGPLQRLTDRKQGADAEMQRKHRARNIMGPSCLRGWASQGTPVGESLERCFHRCWAPAGW